MEIERNWTIFRKVEDFERYEVSIHGDIRNRKTKRILKPFTIGKGYQAVTLTKVTNKRKIKYVHRLVGKAFIENKGFPEINHKDEVKDNNHYSNLEWCTHQYNINYGTRTARRSATIKRNNRLKEQEC